MRHAYFVIRSLFLLPLALSAYGQQFTLGSTTTTRNASPTDNVFYLASVAGISAGSGIYVQDSESAPGELMQVRSINGLAVTVVRSQVGTKQTAHKDGATVLTGQFVWFQSTPAQGYCNDAVLFSPWVNVISGIRYECSANAWTAVNGGGGGGGITTVNGQNGPAITIEQGTGITVDTTTDTVTISATGGGGGQPVPSGNGIVVNNGGASLNRSVAGTANEITVTNGDGVSGNPTVAISATLDLTSNTSTIPQAGGSSLPATCTAGEKFFWTTEPNGMKDQTCTATNTWMPIVNPIPPWAGVTPGYCLTTDGSSITWEPCGSGGGGIWEHKVNLAVQNTLGGAGISCTTAACSAPNTYVSFSSGGSPSNVAVIPAIVLADNNGATFEFRATLPDTLPTNGIKLVAKLSSGSTSQAYQNNISTACSGTNLDPSFNSPQAINFTSSGSAGTASVQTISTLTLTGCSGGDEIIVRWARVAGDTSTVAENINSLILRANP